MNQILIGIDNDVMNIYRAEAEKRGYASGQAFIAALLANWQAILAPAQPQPRPHVTAAKLPYTPNDYIIENYREGEDTPFGAGY